MSTFFERNKRKGSLAALLLLLRRGKGVVALLVLVSVLSGIFILPGGMRIPWFDKVGGKFGFSTRSDKDFSGMTKAMNTARQDDRAWTLGGLGRRLMGRSLYTPNASSSMELVLKKVDKKVKDASTTVGTPESVAGVMRPEDVSKRDSSVELTRDEFLGGLVRSANAAAMASGGPMAAGGPMADGGQMAKNLEMASASNPGDGLLGQALSFANVPGAGGAPDLPKKVAGGKVDKLRSYSITQSLMSFYQTDPAQGKKTFYGLAEARAYSVTAAQPLCADSNNCPKEYASTTAGLVFDGGTSHAEVMSNTDFGETSSPSVPDQKSIKPIVDESNKYYDDVQDCDAVDQWANNGQPLQVKNAAGSAFNGMTIQQACQSEYNAALAADPAIGGRPLTERFLMYEMQHQSCLMNCGNQDATRQECRDFAGEGCKRCDSGSCDKTTAQVCKGFGQKMKAVCKVLNCVFEKKHNACPLAAGQPMDQHSCDQ